MSGRASFVGSLILVGLLVAAPPPAPPQVRPGQGPSIDQAQAERYDGPKARIAVADFEDKMSSSGQYRAEYGRGMADMLATALFNTNRFIVLERQKLSFVLAEQDLGASGRVKRETAAPIGELEGAELLVTAAVTGFDPGTAGGGGTAGGILGDIFGRRAGQVLGNVAGGFKRAHLALDVRIVDTKTGRVVAANSVQGSATEFSGSLGVATTTLGGALGGFAKTPMERAIREAIQASVDFIVSKTPTRYYRVAAAAPSPPPVPELQSGPPAMAPPGAMGAPPGMGMPGPTGYPSAPPPGGMPAPPSAAAPPPSMAPSGSRAGPGSPMVPAASPAVPPPTYHGGPMAPGGAGATPSQVANLPPSAPVPSPRLIPVDRNPMLTAELTEARQRGAVVSVAITVRNPGEAPQRLEVAGQDNYLLDYTDGKKYELIALQGRRTLELGPNEQAVLRATFRAPQNASSVAVVLEEIGTFDDVPIVKEVRP